MKTAELLIIPSFKEAIPDQSQKIFAEECAGSLLNLPKMINNIRAYYDFDFPKNEEHNSFSAKILPSMLNLK